MAIIQPTQIQRTYLIRRRYNMDFESLKSSASNFDKITKALEAIQINQRPLVILKTNIKTIDCGNLN